jgi:protein subunit release factor A
MDFFGLKMVMIPGETEQNIIMMMQFPAALAGNEAQLQEQMQTQMQQQFGNASYNVEFVEDREIEINGEETTLSILKGRPTRAWQSGR